MFNKKISRYQKAFKRYGVNSRALQWGSKQAAEVRYRELVKDINFEGKNILDVGCGFADIIPFIEKKATKFNYTGVDIVPEFIEVCKDKYKNHRFMVRDYFAEPIEKKYDIVMTSGTLNSNIKNALTFRKRAIKTMFEHAKEVVAFNMAGGYPQPENKKGYRVYYADSLKILSFCMLITNKIIFRHHYRRKDFTIVMFKRVRLL